MGLLTSKPIEEDTDLMNNIANACANNTFPCRVVYIQDCDGLEEIPYSEQFLFDNCQERAFIHLSIARNRFPEFDIQVKIKRKISMGPTVAKTTFTISKK